MASRLDLNGLTYLWSKIKAKFATKDPATTSVAGLMSAADKTKLDGIASGAQVNSITGVKGNAESTYRAGNVNLTPANIGALPDTTPIPTRTSDLTNDSGFITQAQVDHLGFYIDSAGYICQRIGSDT